MCVLFSKCDFCGIVHQTPMLSSATITEDLRKMTKFHAFVSQSTIDLFLGKEKCLSKCSGNPTNN